MSLLKPKKKYRFEVGDLITPAEAAALLGYKSAQNFHGERLSLMEKNFRGMGCTLTTGIFVGSQRRFLRSEIDAYISAVVDYANERKAA